MTDLSCVAALMGGAALLFKVPCLITEQALIDVCTLVHEMAGLPTLVAVCIVLIGTVLPPVCEVVESCVGVSTNRSDGMGNSEHLHGVTHLDTVVYID
jgi:putative effector of murein hydrolase